uniref:Reverse transcriptase Ty1/copia-type domain-containing protein n=1 Tax=Bracon brevicornis TaxID=1563983 RepID=A0A6V7LZU6_9HYME
MYTNTNQPVIGYPDAHWGGCVKDRRSYTGYAFLLGGSVISWKSQKQRSVALLSTEAEYVSLAEATEEAIGLRSLLLEIGLDDFSRITLLVDNRSAILLASDSVFHAQTKHNDIKHHFIRDVISEGFVILLHTPTNEMGADVLTKALPRQTYRRSLQDLGMIDLEKDESASYTTAIARDVTSTWHIRCRVC